MHIVYHMAVIEVHTHEHTHRHTLTYSLYHTKVLKPMVTDNLL